MTTTIATSLVAVALHIALQVMAVTVASTLLTTPHDASHPRTIALPPATLPFIDARPHLDSVPASVGVPHRRHSSSSQADSVSYHPSGAMAHLCTDAVIKSSDSPRGWGKSLLTL